MQLLTQMKNLMQHLTHRISPTKTFWVIFILLFLIWGFVSFYRIEYRYWPSWDTGQYGFTMYDWQTTGQIPWYGPHIYFTHFDLPPYFYWLSYPFYLLDSGGIHLYRNIAVFVYTWVILIGLALLVYKQPQHRWPYLLTIAILCFTPIIVWNNVYAWNPSLVWQPVLATWYCLILVGSSKHKNLLVITSGATLALSLTFNLLVIPIAIGLGLISVIRLKKQCWIWLTSFAVASLILWSPIFIQQHHRIIYTIENPPRTMTTNNSFIAIVQAFFIDGLIAARWPITPINQLFLARLAYICITLGIALPIAWQFWKNRLLPSFKQEWFGLLLVLVVTVTVSAVSGITEVKWHYPIGLIVVLMMMIANLPGRIKYVLGMPIIGLFLIITVLYIKPTRPNHTNIANTCLAQVCDHVHAYEYHYAIFTHWPHEHHHSYVLTLSGCPPAVRLQSEKFSTNELLNVMESNPTYPLLVLHNNNRTDAGVGQFHGTWIDYYLELQPDLETMFPYALVSIQCHDSLGWTLYSQHPPVDNPY